MLFRSLADARPAGEAAEAHEWCIRVGQKSWTGLSNNRSQGQLAIALFRSGERETAESIIESLKQRAVGGPRGEQAADRGEANWQGMWWRNRHPMWWSWAQAPIETQSLMIEAFDEIVGDAESAGTGGLVGTGASVGGATTEPSGVIQPGDPAVQLDQVATAGPTIFPALPLFDPSL